MFTLCGCSNNNLNTMTVDSMKDYLVQNEYWIDKNCGTYKLLGVSSLEGLMKILELVGKRQSNILRSGRIKDSLKKQEIIKKVIGRLINSSDVNKRRGEKR